MGDRERTKLGTPRAEGWDTDWFRRVDMFERGVGRRVCGAHAPDGEPCELGSKHMNGRCRFHGGHPDIGGQKGNRNAVTHGLYSRKLRQCSAKCPIWDSCPYADEDVMGLSARKRPLCFYERRDYDRIMNGFAGEAEAGGEKKVPAWREKFMAGLGSSPDKEKSASGSGGSGSSPEGDEGPASQGEEVKEGSVYAMILNDTTALLYTMFNRAAAAVSAHELTEETVATGEKYSMKTTKVSATAFMRIGRELQAHLRLRHLLVATVEGEDDGPKSLPGLMQPIMEQGQPVLDELIAEEREKART